MKRGDAIRWPVILLAIVVAGWVLGHGLVLPLLPAFGVLGSILDALITLLLILAASSIAVEMVREHHRAVARQAGHHGARAARGSVRAARMGGGKRPTPGSSTGTALINRAKDYGRFIRTLGKKTC